MQVVRLDDLLGVSKDESEIYDYLATFSSSSNTNVQDYLYGMAIESEKRSITRTYLVVDESDNDEIIGYFSLMVKPFSLNSQVSKSARARLTTDKHAEVFNCMLIAQLGRSDMYKGKVSGQMILKLAIETCKLVHDTIGMRVVCVEYDDNPFLNDFYLSNDFRVIQNNGNNKLLAYIKF